MKAHCQIAFPHSHKDEIYSGGLHGITDTTALKSAIEEKMFWKVTLPSTLIFPAKQDDCTINLALSFYLCLNLKPLEKCFFSDVGLRDMIVT